MNFGYPLGTPLYFEDNENKDQWIIFKWLVQSCRTQTGTLNSSFQFPLKNLNKLHSHILSPATKSHPHPPPWKESLGIGRSAHLRTQDTLLFLFLDWDRYRAGLAQQVSGRLSDVPVIKYLETWLNTILLEETEHSTYA